MYTEHNNTEPKPCACMTKDLKEGKKNQPKKPKKIQLHQVFKIAKPKGKGKGKTKGK